MLAKLIKYCSIESVSGNEQNILKALVEDCSKIPDVHIMENSLSTGLLVRKGSLENKNIILLDAHIDQCCELQNIEPKIEEDKFTATALDDRIGVTIILEILSNIDSKFTILASFTTKEEIGFIGAKHMIRKIKYKYKIFPTKCIVIDVSYSDVSECPYSEIKKFPKIGGGCRINENFEERNLTNTIYYKYICHDIFNFSVPVLGMHEQISIASIYDITDCYDKICEFIKKMKFIIF